MSNFRDLLNKPLPSAMMESGDEDTTMDNNELEKKVADIRKARMNAQHPVTPYKEDGDEPEEVADDDDEDLFGSTSTYESDDDDCDGDDCDDDDEDEDDKCDGDNCDSDEPCEDCETKKAAATEADPLDPVDAFISDDIGADGADESNKRIVDNIQRVYTPIAVAAANSDEEMEEFAESVEADIAIGESFFTERTIVKFDKVARRAQLNKVAVLAIEKEKKDPMYKKLVTLWAMEKRIEKVLSEKYASQAKARTNEYLKRAKMSKSKTVKKAVSKISK